MAWKRGMSRKEVNEARRVNIRPSIIHQMEQGFKLNELSELMVNSKGKVYVKGHMRNGTWVRPQLRNRPGGKIKLMMTDDAVIYARYHVRIPDEITIKVASGISLNEQQLKIFSSKMGYTPS